MPTECNFIVWNLETLDVLTGYDQETNTATFSSNPEEAYCFDTKMQANAVANLLGSNQFVGGRPRDRA